MKKFLGAIALCSAVLAVCSFVVVRVADADQTRADLVMELLNMPAPPPPNPLERTSRTRDYNDPFYSRDNPPPDNAPIEDILDYWARQRYTNLNDNNLPSPVVLDRITAAMESDSSRITSYLNYLKDSQRGIAAVRSAYDRLAAEEKTSNENANGSTDEYDYEEEYEGEDGYSGNYTSASMLKSWLVMNDPTFSSELEPIAAEAKDTDTGYIQNHNEFLALARNDWGRARPMVDKMYADASQPASKTLATWALYKKALDDGSLSDAEKYRDDLKKTVENRQLTVGVRDLALDALSLNDEWSGRDDWYFSLMKDPTMLEFGSYTGLTTLITRSKAGKYKAKMIKLLESSDPTVRAAAARNLSIDVDNGDVDAINALLPWLENADWIKNTGDARGVLVRKLAEVKVPESVYGLIAVMNERVEMRRYVDNVEMDGEYDANVWNYPTNSVRSAGRIAADTVANASNVYRGPVNTAGASNTDGVPTYAYPYRYSALRALKNQASPVAIPALRRLYNETTLSKDESYISGIIIEALFASGGFSIPQQIGAMESWARRGGEIREQMMAARKANSDIYDNVYGNYSFQGTDEDQFNEKLAGLAIQQDEPPDGLVAATIQRIKALEPREPQTADTLREMVVGWNTRAANAMLLADLKDGKASTESVVNLLTRRDKLRETQMNDVYDARGGVPTAAGIATCILQDTPSYSAILNDANTLVKAAFLACARLVRIPLSPDEVGRELSSPDKKLALAAKMYLLSEDSARSRQILYAHFPNEALIAGSQAFFSGADERSIVAMTDPLGLFASVDARFERSGVDVGYGGMMEIQKAENRFQKEVLASTDVLGIYAYGKNVVRIYADRVTYDKEDDETRSYRQNLSPQEFEHLKRILAEQRVGEMKASIVCTGGCRALELLMLGRAGGSRVFSYTDDTPELFKQLDKFFDELGERPGMLRYAAADKVPGLQVVFADPRLTVETVWADGGDVRFFATDVAARKAADKEVMRKISEFYTSETDGEDIDYAYPSKLREQAEFEARSWYGLSAERIEPSSAPAGIELPPRPAAAGLEAFSGAWSVRGGGAELQTDGEALYKVTGANRVKVADGNFYSLAMSPDGRWILGRTIDDDTGVSAVVRIDSAARRSYPVDESRLRWMVPQVWIPGVNKFLVSFGNYGETEIFDTNQLRFIDPVSGQITPVSGDVVPFAQQSFRPLQQSAGGGFWAAVPDKRKNETVVGIIEMPSLKFTKRLTIPDTAFNSMAMWVDEKESVLYFVYSGHLLRIPMNRG